MFHPNRSGVPPTASLCGRTGLAGVELELISPHYSLVKTDGTHLKGTTEP